MERIRIPKNKYSFEYIKDIKLKNRLIKYLESENYNEETINIKELSDYFLKKYGGYLPKEHKFRFRIEKNE